MGLFDWFKNLTRKKTRPVQGSMLRSVEDRENYVYFASARDSSADAICSTEERRRLRAQCRKILLDVPQALHAARSLALSTYGSGPSIQLKTPDEELNSAVEKLFNLWRRQTNYDKTFFTAIQALPSDGEAFFVMNYAPNTIGNFRIDLIEPYRIESEPDGTTNPDEYDGILYNEFNEPISYSVRQASVNPLNDRSIYPPVIIPACRIKHLYIPILAGQRRGLPMLQQAINTLASLTKIDEATLSACETAASFSFVIESTYDPELGPEDQLCTDISRDNQGNIIKNGVQSNAMDPCDLPIRKNTGIYLPSGMKLSQLKSEQPNVNYQAFKQDCLLGVGAALGAPKNIILNDSSSYNYSSARLDAQVWERWANILQGYIIEILNAHFRDFLIALSYNETVSKFLEQYKSLDDIPVRWYFAAPTHIDRQKEASADVLLLKNKCMTYKDYFARGGRDVNEEFKQMAVEKRMMEELGLNVDDVVTTIEQEDESNNS